MTPSNTPHTEEAGKRFVHSALLVASGLGILSFCVAIDHPEWFHIRPVSGTAMAMAHASEMSAAERAEAPRRERIFDRNKRAVASE